MQYTGYIDAVSFIVGAGAGVEHPNVDSASADITAVNHNACAIFFCFIA
jgi:hypothetical protein